MVKCCLENLWNSSNDQMTCCWQNLFFFFNFPSTFFNELEKIKATMGGCVLSFWQPKWNKELSDWHNIRLSIYMYTVSLTHIYISLTHIFINLLDTYLSHNYMWFTDSCSCLLQSPQPKWMKKADLTLRDIFPESLIQVYSVYETTCKHAWYTDTDLNVSLTSLLDV